MAARRDGPEIPEFDSVTVPFAERPFAERTQVEETDAATSVHIKALPTPAAPKATTVRKKPSTNPPRTREPSIAAKAVPATPNLDAGATVAGRYRLGRKIGQGAFGTVHEAVDTQLDRFVALKRLAPAQALDAEILRRFIQEGRATARVSHPGIVTVFDCGEDNSTAYIAMELLQGESLANRLIRSGRLSLADAMEICRQVAATLHAAHELGVIHRDLKPDNIFLVPDPAHASGERVKVLDFGLAKLRELAAHGETKANQGFGTPRYMAPEQARSAGEVDRRADIYALGCMLFELVCGRAPFEGDLLQVFEGHQKTRAPRAHDFVADIPHGLDTLIARMLEKQPSARPATMAAVQKELQSAGAMTPGAVVTMQTNIAPPAAVAMAATAVQVRPSQRAVQSLKPMPPQASPMAGVLVPMPAAPIRPSAPVFGPSSNMIPVPTLPAAEPRSPARPTAPSSGRRWPIYVVLVCLILGAAAGAAYAIVFLDIF